MKITVALGIAAVSFGFATQTVAAAPDKAKTHDFTTTSLVVKGLPGQAGPQRATTHDFKPDALVVKGLAGGPARSKTFDFKTDALTVRGIAK
jgi:hypothetical protein